MHYLKGMADLSIIYHQKATKSLDGTIAGIYDPEEMEGFTDAHWAGDIETRKSTSGYIFTFAGGPISWSSKAQVTLALSSTEAKYVSTTQAAQEAIYLCTFLSELNLPPSSPSFYVTTKVPYPSQNPLLLTPDSNILTSDTTSYDQPSQMVTLKWNGSPPWTKWPTS